MELKYREGQARICEFTTPHGTIETPTVLPVINPNLNAMDFADMRKLGVQAVITNSYIIRRNERLREEALSKGLHSLLGFDGPIMTDSGTFQSYVYGDFEFDNLSQVDFQRKIGSDIGTIVDIFSTPDDSHEKAETAVNVTYERYLEAKSDGMILSAPVQGSVYPDLRRKAGRLMASADPGYYAIGGVVPLLESYRYDTLVDIIGNVKKVIDPSRPLHLFGAGHPMFLPMAVLMGIDFFDSASYVKYARDNRLLFSDGTRDLSRITYFPDWSPLYGEYTARELESMDSSRRTALLSEHNMAAIFYEIREIKERIREQTLWNYVEMKSRAHPSLFRAFRRYIRNYSHPNEHELSGKSPFYYFDRSSLLHPAIRNLVDFTKLYLKSRRKPTVVLDQKFASSVDRDHSSIRNIYENYDVNVLLSWNGIVLPVELMNTYPVQQFISSGFYGSNIREQSAMIEKHTGNHAIQFLETGESFSISAPGSHRNLEREMLRVISEYQFGLRDGSLFITDEMKIRVSRKTGRIRTVQKGDGIFATLRPSDGLLTLNYAGGKLLRDILPHGRLSVEVSEDSVPFNADGLNVFAKFVLEADKAIRPGNETLIMNGGELVAVGRSVLSGNEMTKFSRGIAVNVRQGRNRAD